MYKKCPFCGGDPTITNCEDFIALHCKTCAENGINISIKAKTEAELMKKWNERTAFISKRANEDEHGKVTYGDLILPNGDRILCDADHKYELLEYLGLDSELFTNLTYEYLCRNLGIVRVSSYLAWTSIDLPDKPTKAQLDKLIELIYNSSKLQSYSIFYKEKEEKFDNAGDCIMRLDKIR